MHPAYLVLIFNLVFFFNAKDLCKLMYKYRLNDPQKPLRQATFNWYLHLVEGRQLIVINYVTYTTAFAILPNFPNPEIAAQIHFWTPFLLGIVPVFIHIYCSYWWWVLANTFDLLHYYEKKMEEYKIINLLINIGVGTLIWFVCYANYVYFSGNLKTGFIADFFSMVFSWQHILIMVCIHLLSIIQLDTFDFSKPFFDALYKATNYPSDEAVSNNEVQKIHTTTQSDQFDLPIASFIFAMSDGNYTDICIDHTQGMHVLSKRISIKDLQLQISSDPRFFRCHKSYLINFDAIDSYTGNSHGLKITLHKLPDKIIPVSRKQVVAFKTLYQEYLLQKKQITLAQH